jgi:hypothetical protein
MNKAASVAIAGSENANQQHYHTAFKEKQT